MFKLCCFSLLLTACGAEFTAEPSLPIAEEAGQEATTAEAGVGMETSLPLQDAARAEGSTEDGGNETHDASPDSWLDAGNLGACCQNASDQYWHCLATNPIACPNGGQTIPDSGSDRWCLACEPTWNSSNGFCLNLCMHP